MVKTIHISNYFVAFIDIVGQRDKLKQLISLPSNAAENRDVAHILSETSEYVKNLRGQFDTFFKAAAKPTGLLDHLKPEQRAWVERRKQAHLWHRGFSDSYFMTVPCWDDSSWGAHILAIYRAMFQHMWLIHMGIGQRKAIPRRCRSGIRNRNQ
jgi:hypothetical protein